MKASILLSIGSLMIVGILGINKISKYFENNKWTSLMMSVSFGFLNYTMCNWFLRGAMAEFTAMMIVPYLILEELKLLKTKKYSYRLGIILFLIYFSHSIIGYYSIFTIIFCLVILCFNISLSEAIKVFKGLIISGLIMISVLLIYLIPMYLLSDYFNPSHIKENNFYPTKNYVEFIRYLYDYKYKWFSNPYWMLSVQFDLSVMITIIISLALFTSRIKAVTIDTFKKQSIILILLLDVFFILLQLKPFGFFYKYVPGADFIQFPWRLVSFIQVLHLAILLWIFSYFESMRFKKLSYILPGIILFSVVIFYPTFKGVSYGWLSEEAIQNPNVKNCNNGEYLPSIYGDGFSYLSEHMFLFRDKGFEIKEKNNSIFINYEYKLEEEATDITLSIHFRNASEAILPFTYTRLTRICRTDPKTKKTLEIPFYRTDSDPRIRVFLPRGEYDITIFFPSLKSLFFLNTPLFQLKKRQYIKTPFETVECDAETLSEQGRFLVAKDGKNMFLNERNRSSEKAHSGNFSVKLGKENSFGFIYKWIFSKDYQSEWEFSAWRYGGKLGSLAIQIKDTVYISNSKVSETDQTGWELLKIRFKFPPQIKENDIVTLYVNNYSTKDSAYFDDFKLVKVEQVKKE